MRLLDARAMNRQYPTTFEVPTEARIERLRPGEQVKLLFNDGVQTERMWVLITKVRGGKIPYVGVLRNGPVVIRGVSYGDVVEFQGRHVASTET